MWMFSQNLTLERLLMHILAALVIVFLVLPLHECAHGWVAGKLGDRTAEFSGGMTLNPLEHFDILGAVGLLIFGYGWAKPVPVDPSNFKKPRRDMALVALAGPVSNVLAAIAGGLILNCLSAIVGVPVALKINMFVNTFVRLNVSLAVFNLIPLPALDGFRILEGILSPKMLEKYYEKRHIIILITFVLLFIGVFNLPLNILENFLFSFIIRLINIPFLIF